MTFSTKINPNNMVNCPHCDVEFKIEKTKRGDGAAYTRNWKTIPPNLRKILKTWLDTDMVRLPLTKMEIRDKLNKAGISLSENSASARISELLGMNLIIIVDKETRFIPQRTKNIPRYLPDRQAYNYARAANWCNIWNGRR